MKARRKIKVISLAIIALIIASANVSFSQDEYDDMYFNPKDRKEVKFNEEALKSSSTTKSYENKDVAKNTSTSDVINPAYSPGEYGDLEENYSAKNLNPEYIARYKNNPKDSEGMGEVAEGDSYYDDYYDRAVMPGETGQDTDQKKYAYPSSYYGGSNAMSRTRMYGNSMYDPFMGGGFGRGLSFGLGYSMGFMPGFSMSMGYGTGMGYGGYNPYGFYDPFSPFGNPYYSMSRFHNPYYSPWGYDPYNSMMGYGYGGPGYYCPYPGYSGYGSGMNLGYVSTTASKGTNVSNSNAIPASNSYESPGYRNRVARGSDQATGVNTDAANTRTSARRINTDESQSVANARIASDRDFSQSQNEYYNRSGSRNATSTVSNSATSRSTIRSTGSTSRSSLNNSSTARVRSSRANSDYSRPSYKSSREQRSLSSSNGRSMSNSGTNRSSGGNYSSTPRSSGSSYSGSRSSGSSSSFSGGSRSSGSSGSSSGGGSRSSGSSGSGSRSGRGN